MTSHGLPLSVALFSLLVSPGASPWRASPGTGIFRIFRPPCPPPYRCLVRRLLEGCVLCNSLRLRPAFHCNRLSFKAFGRRRPSSPPFMRGDGPVGPGIRSTYRTPPKISINKYMYIYIGRERERASGKTSYRVRVISFCVVDCTNLAAPMKCACLLLSDTCAKQSCRVLSAPYQP